MARGKPERERDETRKPDHIVEDAPGGAAQLDPTQQTHRRDLEDEEVPNGEGQIMRGNVPPNSGKTRHDAQSPAVPGSSTDRGERPKRDGRVGT